MDTDETLRPYLETVRGKQRSYAMALIRENEKLRSIASALEGENRRLESEVLDARLVLQQREELRRATEWLEAERARVAAEVAHLEADRIRHQEELEHLRVQLGDIQAENRRYAEQYMEIEQQSSNLANLYVASYQLNSTIDRDEVLTAIKEIVINLIGSENFGLFEREAATGDLHLATSFGIDTSALAKITPGSGRRDQLMTSGELYVAENTAAGATQSPSFAGLVASVPLKINGELLGVIAIFGLLDHKPSLESVDLELFDLLAAHAAKALYCSNLHATRLKAADAPGGAG